MVRPEGRHPGAERLRGGPRRVLAAPVLDRQRDRERGGGLVEYRSESTAPAREVGWTGCPQAARDAAAVPRGRARRVERGASAHGGGGGSAPAASRAPDLEAGTHAGGEPDERPARNPGPLAAARHRRWGCGEDGAPVGRLARARGAAGPVRAGMGARAIPPYADSRVATRTPARDCPRARRDHRQSPAAAPPARSRAHRRVGLCERVLRVATVPQPQGGRGGGGAHADAVPEWRWEPGTRDQQGGESAHPGGRHRDGLGLVAVSAAEPPELLVSGAVRPRRYPSP